MILETERLILRPMVETDLEDFYDIFSSDEVGRFVNKMSHEAVERYFEKKKVSEPNPFSFAVVLKESGKMIGTCGIKYNKDNNFGEISYVFNAKYWNNGYCTEACKQVMKYGFESGMHRIEADCFEDNYASDKILREKLHMNYEGSLKIYAFNSATGKVMPFKFFGITREEYLKRCQIKSHIKGER